MPRASGRAWISCTRSTAAKRPAIGPNVVVIGGGDVAMDAARCARRLPGVKSVHLACLESRAEMPAHSWEAAEALEEGIVFHNSLGPDQDRDRRPSSLPRLHQRVRREQAVQPQFDDSKTSALEADTVIVTIGQGIDAAGLGVATGPGGRIVADKDTLATNIPGIFAGGDAVLGPASMVDAMAQGHRAAEAIDAYLRGAKPVQAPVSALGGTGPPIPGPTPRGRSASRCRRPSAAERLRDFTEIDLGYSRSRPSPRPSAAWPAVCAASACSASRLARPERSATTSSPPNSRSTSAA